MVIRPAASSDLPRLIELFQLEIACQKRFAPSFDFPANFDVGRFAKLKLGNRQERVFVAELDGAIAGYINVRVLRPGQFVWVKRFVGSILRRQLAPSFVRLGTLGWIEDCFVESRFRRQGIAGALAAEGIGWLRERGVRRIELATFAANGRGIAFWQKQGFSTYRLLMSNTAD